MKFTEKELSVIETALTLYIQSTVLKGYNSELTIANRMVAGSLVSRIEMAQIIAEQQ